MSSGQKYEHQWTKIGKHKAQEEIKVKLSGITTGNELIFDSHISKKYMFKS